MGYTIAATDQSGAVSTLSRYTDIQCMVCRMSVRWTPRPNDRGWPGPARPLLRSAHRWPINSQCDPSARSGTDIHKATGAAIPKANWRQERAQAPLKVRGRYILL